MRLQTALRLAVALVALPLVGFGGDDPLRGLAERLGGSVFPAEAGQPVTQLMLNNSAVSDDDIAAVAGRTDLQVLFLRGTAITDAGMAHLATATGLYQLDLSGTKITDAGLVYLARMEHLVGLQLAETAVTDDGLRLLAALTTLRSVNLERTAVTAAGVESLRGQLPTVRIQSDAGLAAGDAVASQVAAAQDAAAQAAMARSSARTAAAPETPACSDLTAVDCLKSELSSGVPARCIAATNAIAETRNQRVQRGEVGADPELVPAMAEFLFELAQKDGDRCRSSGFTGLDWLGPGVGEVLPAGEVVPFMMAEIDAARRTGRIGSQQASALRILACFGEDAAEAVPMLAEIVADKDSSVTRSARPDAVAALAAIGQPARSTEPLLLEVMSDPTARDYRDVETRMLAAEALLSVGADPELVAARLVPWLTDDERDLRVTARRVLIDIGEPAAPAVAASLSSSNPEAVYAAIDVLGEMGSAAQGVVPDVVAAVLATGDPGGQLESLLGDIGPGDDRDVAALAAALSGDDESVQARAASILGSWGAAARPALPALKRLAASDSSASFIAEMAVSDIEGGGSD